MPFFTANDGVKLYYQTHGSDSNPPLILLHGFTGSSQVFKRNIPALSQRHHVLVPDLRGHGDSEKPRSGYHVSRLAMDLRNLLEHLNLLRAERKVAAVGASLGAAVLWSYAELFTPSPITTQIFIDQSPLQNLSLPDWTSAFCNRGMNSPSALQALQTTLSASPATAHLGTIASCLGYRSHPQRGDPGPESATWQEDEAFFLAEAMKCDARWVGKLMEDHTGKDWRDVIGEVYARSEEVRVLVVASERSGCFPAAGPLRVVELVNGEDGGEGNGRARARGEVVEWGGHWCYWEEAGRFDRLVLDFLDE